MDDKAMALALRMLATICEDIADIKKHIGMDTYVSYSESEMLDEAWRVARELEEEDWD